MHRTCAVHYQPTTITLSQAPTASQSLAVRSSFGGWWHLTDEKQLNFTSDNIVIMWKSMASAAEQTKAIKSMSLTTSAITVGKDPSVQSIAKLSNSFRYCWTTYFYLIQTNGDFFCFCLRYIEANAILKYWT